MKSKFLTLTSCLLLAACAGNNRPTLFEWGNYQQHVYDNLHSVNEDAGKTISETTATIEAAKANNRRIAPGVLAHLGMMYQKEGQPQLARQYFNQEKQTFPESVVLMDYLLKNK